MELRESTWQQAFEVRTDLEQYGDNGIGLFALALKFTIDDIHSVAAEAVTDGSDDKKCDLIYIDKEEGVAVVSQCYCSSRARESAPSNKAADLNTAVAWLLQRDEDDLPARLIAPARALRAAVSSGEVKRFEVWYVHNLPQSRNVEKELATVEHTAKAALERLTGAGRISVASMEVGTERLNEWYSDTLSPILVNDEVKIEITNSGFEISEGRWRAYVMPIQAKRLHSLYKKHKASLFSANVRDYLGSRKSDANINNGIKDTAENDPENFWVFNNGITVLTHSFAEMQERGKRYLVVRGLSIVNGAQTTGAIGSLSLSPDSTVLVPARFVATSDEDIVYKIIQFNNSQNKVTASDFRSTDRIQKRLREEVSHIPDAKYEGGRRGGSKDVIERNNNLLPSYTVGQALAAFNQDPIVAYHQKSEIWVNDKLYAKYFNEDTSGVHIVFAYGLLRAVEEKKRDLVTRSKKNAQLGTEDESLLGYFRHRGSTYLLVAAIASCLGVFLGKRLTNATRISFGAQVSPRDATKAWSRVVDIVSPLSEQLIDGINDGLKSADRIAKVVTIFRNLVQVTAVANAEEYRKFAQRVVIK